MIIKLKGKNLKPFLKLHQKYILNRKRYEIDESLLREHIKRLSANHKQLQVVYFKSTLINSFFSTRMGADLVFDTAQKICGIEESLQQIIQKGPSENLEKLTSCFEQLKNKGGNRNYYPFSFFTKYLAIHSRILSKEDISKFPIYDRLVEKVIKNSDIYSQFTQSKHYKDTHCGRNLKQYQNLYHTLEYFSKCTKCDFTSLDKILWLIGKAKFSPNKAPELKPLICQINKLLK